MELSASSAVDESTDAAPPGFEEAMLAASSGQNGGAATAAQLEDAQLQAAMAASMGGQAPVSAPAPQPSGVTSNDDEELQLAMALSVSETNRSVLHTSFQMYQISCA